MKTRFIALAAAVLLVAGCGNGRHADDRDIRVSGDAEIVSADTGPTANPDTWTGAVIARLEKTGSIVTGDATLTMDRRSQSMSVVISNVAHPAGELADMTWSGLPIRDNRFVGEGFRGRFYGVGRERIVGPFWRNGVIGYLLAWR